MPGDGGSEALRGGNEGLGEMDDRGMLRPRRDGKDEWLGRAIVAATSAREWVGSTKNKGKSMLRFMGVLNSQDGGGHPMGAYCMTLIELTAGENNRRAESTASLSQLGSLTTPVPFPYCPDYPSWVSHQVSSLRESFDLIVASTNGPTLITTSACLVTFTSRLPPVVRRRPRESSWKRLELRPSSPTLPSESVSEFS